MPLPDARHLYKFAVDVTEMTFAIWLLIRGGVMLVNRENRGMVGIFGLFIIMLVVTMASIKYGWLGLLLASCTLIPTWLIFAVRWAAKAKE